MASLTRPAHDNEDGPASMGDDFVRSDVPSSVWVRAQVATRTSHVVAEVGIGPKQHAYAFGSRYSFLCAMCCIRAPAPPVECRSDSGTGLHMDVESRAVTPAVGAAAGWLARTLVSSGGFGALGNIVPEIVGAVIVLVLNSQVKRGVKVWGLAAAAPLVLILAAGIDNGVSAQTGAECARLLQSIAQQKDQVEAVRQQQEVAYQMRQRARRPPLRKRATGSMPRGTTRACRN